MKNKNMCIFLLLIASCVGNHNKQGVTISSEPEGAYIYVDGWIAKTPVNLPLSGKDRNEVIEVKNTGYKDAKVKIPNQLLLSKLLLQNLFAFYIYPLAIFGDIVSGDAWKLDDNINIILEPIDVKND